MLSYVAHKEIYFHKNPFKLNVKTTVYGWGRDRGRSRDWINEEKTAFDKNRIRSSRFSINQLNENDWTFESIEHSAQRSMLAIIFIRISKTFSKTFFSSFSIFFIFTKKKTEEKKKCFLNGVCRSMELGVNGFKFSHKCIHTHMDILCFSRKSLFGFSEWKWFHKWVVS